MRKIGIVTEFFYPHIGGITEHVDHFAGEMAQRGYEVVIITSHTKKPLGKELPNGVRVRRLGRAVPIYSNASQAKVTLGWRLGYDIKKILSEEKFDLIHIHNPIQPALPLLFHKYSDTVTVGTLHSQLPLNNPFFRFFKKYIQQYLDHLDGLIAVSPSCVPAVDQFFDVDFTIIPNGVDVGSFAKAEPFPELSKDDSPLLLFVGRLEIRKGLHVLLHAMPLVQKAIPQVRLVIVGDGAERSHYEAMVPPDLRSQITFAGVVSAEDLKRFYKSATVFVAPATHRESFGIVLLEAMAAGKPVVAADNPGFVTVIQNNVNGCLTRRHDHRDLADKIIYVLRDPVFAQRLIRNGQKKVGPFDWPLVTDQILDYYDKVYLKSRGEPFRNEGQRSTNFAKPPPLL